MHIRVLFSVLDGSRPWVSFKRDPNEEALYVPRRDQWLKIETIDDRIETTPLALKTADASGHMYQKE